MNCWQRAGNLEPHGEYLMIKLAIFLGWVVLFAVLSYGAKTLATGLPPASLGVRHMIGFVWTSVWFYVIICLYVGCATLYMGALRIMPLSVAGPLFTVAGSVVALILGIVFFREDFSPAKLMGIMLCVAGIYLLSAQTC